jgi:uncharacterized membrane protein YgcG
VLAGHPKGTPRFVAALPGAIRCDNGLTLVADVTFDERHRAVRDVLADLGAVVSTDRVVVDGDVITSAGVSAGVGASFSGGRGRSGGRGAG